MIEKSRPLRGSTFTGFDFDTTESPEALRAAVARILEQRLKTTELHPDVWQPIVVRSAAELGPGLAAVAGAKYSYRELDRYTEQIEKLLKTVSSVGRVTRSGVLPEQVELAYSQERWGGAQRRDDQLRQALAAPSVPSPAGAVDAGSREVNLVPDADFQSVEEIGAMLISVLSIFLALVVQFRHAVKPLIVFAAIPFGIGGALVGLAIMGEPFGFMAFLGVASLIGVIVCHIIVLFDFIEDRHEHGAPLREALLDAGILRLRPVLITVGATVIALIPLALNGGPLWEPLCYAQIAGLTVSTLITLLLVPVVYAIFVLDLKWVKWERPAEAEVQSDPAGIPPRLQLSPACE